MICCGKQRFASVSVADCLKRRAAAFFTPITKLQTDEKSAIFLILMLPASLASFAQGNGMAGISEATNMVTSYFDPLTKLIFAVAAVLGLVGGVRVYSKFNSGDPDASKSATALFLSCVFLVIVGTVLRSFFL